MRKGGRKEGAKDKEGERGEGEKKLQNLKWGRTRGEFLLPNLMRTAPAPAAPILDNLMMIKERRKDGLDGDGSAVRLSRFQGCFN